MVVLFARWFGRTRSTLGRGRRIFMIIRIIILVIRGAVVVIQIIYIIEYYR